MILGKGHGLGYFLSPAGGWGAGVGCRWGVGGGLQADQPRSCSQGPWSSSQRPWGLDPDEGVGVQSWGLEKGWVPPSSLWGEAFMSWKGVGPKGCREASLSILTLLTPCSGRCGKSGTRGSLRTMHGGGSAPSCCAFTHRVAFEEGSGPRQNSRGASCSNSRGD